MSKESLTTREEVFAPVVALYRFKTEEEALKLANDCDVGLGSFIMTESVSRSWRVAEALEVGMVGVNLGMLSACENPFGGESCREVSAHRFVDAITDHECFRRRQRVRVRERRWPRGHLGVCDGEEYLHQCGELKWERKYAGQPTVLIDCSNLSSLNIFWSSSTRSNVVFAQVNLTRATLW